MFEGFDPDREGIREALGVPAANALNLGFHAAFMGAAVIAVGAALVAARAIRAPRQADSAEAVQLKAA